MKPAQDSLSMYCVSVVLLDTKNQYFRFAKWIKEQKLPKEVKAYCKNVLNYLGQYDDDFDLMGKIWDDE